jgi:hypothetical protein
MNRALQIRTRVAGKIVGDDIMTVVEIGLLNCD